MLIIIPKPMPTPSVHTFVKIAHLLKQRRLDVVDVRPDNDDFCQVHIKCNMCKGETPLRVSFMGLYKWLAKDYLIQDAITELEPESRELLVSGVCSGCFNKLFPPQPPSTSSTVDKV